jgi:Calcineurin-like phosphoesterase
MLHLRSARSALLPLGAFVIATALSACGQNNHPSAGTGSADVSVQALSGVPLGQVTVAISGPPLYTPKAATLSPQGVGGGYGALISSLPVGSNYLFTVTASDANNVVSYRGQAVNVAILRNHVTTVVITAQPVNPGAPYNNAVPVIDSLVVSSTSIAPGESITAKVTAHDPDAADSITFTWSAAPAGSSFSSTSAATTTWTSPATEGDVALTIQVKDNHGATTSATITIHVANANGKGQADVNVKLNNWPVITDVSAVPGWITPGASTALSVTASDSDGDALTYQWTSTCASGVFTSVTSATPGFTLPISSTDKTCEFDVAVSDGRGGSTTGTTVLPVGAPVSIVAPAIVDAAQSAAVVDPSATVLFYVEAMDPQASSMHFQWSALPGSLSGESDSATTSQVTLTAPNTPSTSVVVSVVVTDDLGASKKYDFSLHTAAAVTTCTPPASTAWTFGVMADTQWTVADDGSDPDSVAVAIINQLNAQFIANHVNFVIQVGDITDSGTNPALDKRAEFAQALYDANIGYFPLRGNHEPTAAAAAEFKRLFPQTLGGMQNATPTLLFGDTTDDANTHPVAVAGAPFAMGLNFSRPSSVLGSTMTAWDGLSYSFDFNNARFVLLDQFMKADGTSSDSNYQITPQNPWISATLAGKPAGGHAFVFGHKGIITENHTDTLFGSDPSQDPVGQDAFITSLASNGVHYYMGGHDHMHNRSIVTTTDGVTAKVQDIIASSDSSKFYTPINPSNDQKYDVPAFHHTRETPIVQELNTVGYYIFTVDGARVSVDFFSAIVNPSGGVIAATPLLSFSKREAFGYGLTGQETVVAESASYVGSLGSFAGTSASILSGSNPSTVKDASNRPLSHLVDSAWDAGTCATSSAILTLWGTSDLGSASGDTIALSMSFDRSSVSDATLVSGGLGLATQDSAGNWTNAVAQNVGGTPNFVLGPWSASYTLGTWGVDLDSNTVWAVVNHAGRFAAARF